MTDATHFTPGTVLAQKYKLSRLLGQGGMGSVWLAENIDIGRTVAIKVLLHRFANDAEMLQRFRMEARAAAAIGHPGIVDVLDMGQLPDGSAFIVMEQLRGETLGERLTRTGPLPVDAALWVFHRILDAVGAAHAAGVVHRDLKPDNLFLVRKPVAAVKVLDFGISKFKSTEDLSLTRTGMTMGTPLYMSPEQARGAKEVGPAADLYSLGAIFYHALVGTPPFQGESYNELLARVLTESHAPLAQVRADLPAPLHAVVDALLSKQAVTRPGSEQVRAAIAQVYALTGLSRETPASILHPPGLGEVPSEAPRPVSLNSNDGVLGSTSPSGRRPSAETPMPFAGRPAEAPLDATSPSQRQPSVETPIPLVALAPGQSEPPLDSTSPSQRRPSAETPEPGVVAARNPSVPPPIAPVVSRSKPPLPVAPLLSAPPPTAPVVSRSNPPASVVAAALITPPGSARPLGTPAKKSKRTRWLVAGAVGLGLLVVCSGLIPGDGDDPSDSAAIPGQQPEVVDTTADDAPQLFTTTLEVVPSEATLLLDPGGACPNPCTFRDEVGEFIDVRVEAKGYKPRELSIRVGDRPKVRLELKKLKGKAFSKTPP